MAAPQGYICDAGAASTFLLWTGVRSVWSFSLSTRFPIAYAQTHSVGAVLCCAVHQAMRTRWPDAWSSSLVPGRRRGSKIQDPAGANAAFGYTALLPLRGRRERDAINAVLQALMEPGG